VVRNNASVSGFRPRHKDDGYGASVLPKSEKMSSVTQLSVRFSGKRWHQERGAATFASRTEDDFEDDDDDDDDDDFEDDDQFSGGSEDSHSMQPWKDLLEVPGRAAWRVSAATPEPLLQAMYKILDDGDRTPKQLLRAHRKVLEMHTNLATLRERERRKMVNSGKRTATARRRGSSQEDDDDDNLLDDDGDDVLDDSNNSRNLSNFETPTRTKLCDYQTGACGMSKFVGRTRTVTMAPQTNNRFWNGMWKCFRCCH
jgi:hypothetical protein